MATPDKAKTEKQLFNDVARLIEESRSYVAQTANATLTLLYWKISGRVNSEILGNKRAEYGKQIVATLSRQLAGQYSSFSEKNLRRMVHNNEATAKPVEKFFLGL